MEKTRNYRKAEELVAKGLATKHEHEHDCIDFEVDLDCEAYAWIYPNDAFVTIYYGEDYYDHGCIDLQKMQVIGCEGVYDIIKEAC